MRRRSIEAIGAAVLAGAMAFPGRVLSQNPPAIGEQVRIEYDTTVTEKVLLFIPLRHTENRVVTGKLVGRDADSITIGSGRESDQRRQFSTNAIIHFYVADGTRRNTVKGMLFGAAAATATLFIGWGAPSRWDSGETDDFLYKKQMSLEGAAEFVGGAALIGGLVGWLWTSTHWREVPSSDWKIASVVVPGNGSVLLSLSLRF